MWKLYIIQTRSGKLYTGITKNLEKRFMEHQSSRRGAKFFRMESPQEILFQESHQNRSQAQKREAQIKKMTRKEKLNLIFGKKM